MLVAIPYLYKGRGLIFGIHNLSGPTALPLTPCSSDCCSLSVGTLPQVDYRHAPVAALTTEHSHILRGSQHYLLG